MQNFTMLGTTNWENEFIQSQFRKKPENSARIVKLDYKPKLEGNKVDKSDKNTLWHSYKA